MNQQILKNLVMCFTVLLVISCKDVGESTKSGQSNQAPNQLEKVSCPEAQEPNCQQGEIQKTLRNELNCEYKVCDSEDGNTRVCPPTSEPVCPIGQSPVLVEDSNTCDVYRCAKDTSCPEPPSCGEDKLVTVAIPNSCPRFYCQKQQKDNDEDKEEDPKEKDTVCRDEIKDYEIPLGYERVREQLKNECFKDRLEAKFCDDRADMDYIQTCKAMGRVPAFSFMVPCKNGVKRNTRDGSVTGRCLFTSVSHTVDAFFDEVYPHSEKGCLQRRSVCYQEKSGISFFHGLTTEEKCAPSQTFIDVLNGPKAGRRLITYYSTGSRKIICPRLLKP